MKQPQNPVVIVCSTDARYVRPLAVTLVSLRAQLDRSRQLAVHIIDGGVPQSEKDVLVRSVGAGGVTVSWYPADRRSLVGVPLWGRLPIAVYDKLLIVDLLPSHIHQAIWLDCDTLVLDDVAPLWDRGTGDHAVLAVQDSVAPYVSSRFGVARYRELGLPPEAKYFNAGVLVLNLDRWRRDRVTVRALEYLKAYAREVSFWDQEGLNAVLSGKWGELDPVWNWTAGAARAGTAQRTGTPAKIVHFSGNLKPWIYDGGHAYYQRYYDHVDMTAFAGWRPQPSWRAAAVRSYERAALRRVLYPAEQLGTALWKALTRRLATADDVRPA